jgi:transcriptional regulator with PAS, ATPase and Fis domain
MAQVFELVKKAARSEANILVLGESGTGKELIARAVHANSPRAAQAFVPVDCASLPENLLESELFGHEKGAFTGAVRTKPGLMEVAGNGTLFLDEIGDLPLSLQVKLLRALQERQIRRVGENRNRPVSARVIAATNRDLVKEIRAARFREDLYYRLRVVEIEIPPLRQRREDILPLARAFVADAATRTGRKVSGFTPAAAHQLLRYVWPGNVRELENAIERAVVLTRRGRIDVEDLPAEVGLAVPDVVAPADVRPLAEVEREYITSVLRAVGGNRSQAARKLGIGEATLYRKIKAFGNL